jgi:subtilisin family serine protease
MLNLAGWHKVDFKRAVDIEKVVKAFKKMKGVIDAQPVGIYALDQAPNDPEFDFQWHLSQVRGIDLGAKGAWDIEAGNEEIIVAILDTGVRYYHQDLGGSDASSEYPEGIDGNMWINWEEKDGTAGEDDDNNGFVDDWIGWDFVTGTSSCWRGEDCSAPDNDPRDFNGHGTHVSGIIAALNNNGNDVASPAGGWGDGSHLASGNGDKIMALRIGWSGRYLGREVGYVRMDFAADALKYAADKGARLANASWGSGSFDSGGLGAAVDYFLARGGLLFKSAGNGDNTSADYLGGRDDVIKVAATDQSDCKAGFSSYGPWVDISAPGVSILSTDHDHSNPDTDETGYKSGTSMASPLALSVAALIWSQNPSQTAEQVKLRLMDTADEIDSVSCNSTYSGQLGAGRVNAFKAVVTCEWDFDSDKDVDGDDLIKFLVEVEAGIAMAGDFNSFASDFGKSYCP